MPTPKISLKHFNILLHRRSTALSLLRSTATIATTSSPKPSLKKEEGATPDDNSYCDPHQPQLDSPVIEVSKEGNSEQEVDDQKGLDGGDFSVKPVDVLETSDDSKLVVPENASNPLDAHANPFNPISETSIKENASNDKERRKREVREKLQTLKARKHMLVQVLKQILNAEEELKDRSSIQGMVVPQLFHFK